MGDRAADGPAVSNLEVTDVGDRFGKQRSGRSHDSVVFCHRLPRHRSDREPFAVSTDELQRRNSVQVDEVVKARQPEGEHGYQALPTAENLGVVPVCLEQRDRLIDACRRVVLESSWLHVFCTFEVLRSDETVGALGRGYKHPPPKGSEIRS